MAKVSDGKRVMYDELGCDVDNVYDGQGGVGETGGREAVTLKSF